VIWRNVIRWFADATIWYDMSYYDDIIWYELFIHIQYAYKILHVYIIYYILYIIYYISYIIYHILYIILNIFYTIYYILFIIFYLLYYIYIHYIYIYIYTLYLYIIYNHIYIYELLAPPVTKKHHFAKPSFLNTTGGRSSDTQEVVVERSGGHQRNGTGQWWQRGDHRGGNGAGFLEVYLLECVCIYIYSKIKVHDVYVHVIICKYVNIDISIHSPAMCLYIYMCTWEETWKWNHQRNGRSGGCDQKTWGFQARNRNI